VKSGCNFFLGRTTARSVIDVGNFFPVFGGRPAWNTGYSPA
jgi:hypothetical protein